MKKYKIVAVKTKEILDVIQNPQYIMFLSHGRVYATNKQTAQGVLGTGEAIYSFIDNPTRDVPIVTMHEISDEEFTRLSSLVNSDKQVIDDVTLATAKAAKITELSDQCNKCIVGGFTIKLSDGMPHNFRLTTEDQLNLMLLETKLNAGATSFIYHATNQPCRTYNKTDMSNILRRFKNHVQYHTTYFNVAKQYVNSLTNYDEIAAFSYGADVSTIVANAAIRKVLKGGGLI